MSDLAGKHIKPVGGSIFGQNKVLRARAHQHGLPGRNGMGENALHDAVAGLDRESALDPAAFLGGAGEEVGRADEVGDELALGLAVDFLRRAALDDLAEVEHRDLVGQRQRLRSDRG